MNSFEKYKPSTEEIKKAEDKMSETENKLSEIREANVKEFKQNMPEKNGVLVRHISNRDIEESVYSEAGPLMKVYADKHKITGMIEGHKIDLEANDIGELRSFSQEKSGFIKYRGTIDGKELTSDDAKKLWDKYYDKSVEKNPKEEDLIKRARTEDALKDVV